MFNYVEFNATALSNITTYNHSYYSVINTHVKVGSYFFFIYAKNEWNTMVYTYNLTLIIDFPCENDTFWLN